jgi:hypothetical protein
VTAADTYRPFDPAAHTYSESVLLSAVSDDGRYGVFSRLCRYPDARVAWVWLHVVTADGAWTLVDDRAPCEAHRLDLGAEDLAYTAQPALDGTWKRRGSRHAPTSASLAVSAPMYPDSTEADGTAVDANIELEFTPVHASGGTLAGRSEVIGRAAVRVRVGESAAEFDGAAQWHEQEQSAPRFLVPFSYASLGNEHSALLGLAGPRASGGFVRGKFGDEPLSRFSVETNGSGFAIEAETEDGELLVGDAVATHRYVLPIYGQAWHGAFVTAEIAGTRLAGFLNQWAPDRAASGS